MKHEEVVAALKIIADTGKAKGISKEDLETLRSYVLIEVTNPEERVPECALTKKGRVMLKANSK